jgi:hypothetical protein
MMPRTSQRAIAVVQERQVVVETKGWGGDGLKYILEFNTSGINGGYLGGTLGKRKNGGPPLGGTDDANKTVRRGVSLGEGDQN